MKDAVAETFDIFGVRNCFFILTRCSLHKNLVVYVRQNIFAHSRPDKDRASEENSVPIISTEFKSAKILCLLFLAFILKFFFIIGPPSVVIPAKAGIHVSLGFKWTPAFAGVTESLGSKHFLYE